MGCGCAKSSNSGGTNFSPPTLPQICEYSLPRLEELLLVSVTHERNIVQSQINIYSANCNMFRNIVIPLFTKYSIALQ